MVKVTGIELLKSEKGQLYIVFKTGRGILSAGHLKVKEGIPAEIKGDQIRKEEAIKKQREDEIKAAEQEKLIQKEVDREYDKIHREGIEKVAKIRQKLEKKIRGE